MIVVHLDKKLVKDIPQAAKKKAAQLAGEASKRVSKMELTPGFVKAERKKIRFAKSASLVALGVSAVALAVAVVALSRTGATKSIEEHYHHLKDGAAKTKDAAVAKKDEVVKAAEEASISAKGGQRSTNQEDSSSTS